MSRPCCRLVPLGTTLALLLLSSLGMSPASQAAVGSVAVPIREMPAAFEVVNGYTISDDDGIPFFQAYASLGRDVVGFPISRRFTWDGYPVQAFQKAILQWDPGSQQVLFLNTLDIMHDRGLDDWLGTVRSTPPPLPASFDAGAAGGEEIAARRLALLEAAPAIRDVYNAAPNPLLQYGLPTSPVTDNGSHSVVRFQRVIMQQWKEDVPWAAAGEVTIANSGDIAKETGLIPPPALQPDFPIGGARPAAAAAPPPGTALTPPSGQGAQFNFAPGSVPANSTGRTDKLEAPPPGTSLPNGLQWDAVYAAIYRLSLTDPAGNTVSGFSGRVTLVHPGSQAFVLNEATRQFEPLSCAPAGPGMIECVVPRPGIYAVIQPPSGVPAGAPTVPATIAPAAGQDARFDFAPGAVPANSTGRTDKLDAPPSGSTLPGGRRWESVYGAIYRLTVTDPAGRPVNSFTGRVTIVHPGTEAFLLNEGTNQFEPLACASTGQGMIECVVPRPGVIAVIRPI